MVYDYGYIKKTSGADGEEIDVYMGPHDSAPTAFVVHQLDPATGVYDEDKLFLGFLSAAAARVAFAAHRNDAGAYGGMTAMDIHQLKRWIAGTTPMKGHDPAKEQIKLTVPLSKVLRKSGPYVGPRGGKWADPQHKIPWREEVPHQKLKEEAHSAVRAHVIEAAHKAVEAGADPKDMEYLGAGMEGILFVSGGKAFKVGRASMAAKKPVFGGKPKTLRNEAEAMQSLENTPAAKFVAKVHRYDEKHDVIVREMVEGRPGGWGQGKQARAAYDIIVEELKKQEWSAPEFKEDSFILSEDGASIKMVDVGLIFPRGQREVRHVEQILSGAKSKDDISLLDVGFSIRTLLSEGELKPEKARKMRAQIIEHHGTEGTEIKQQLHELDSAIERVEAKKSGFVIREPLRKAGPFIGPRGGKWADAAHTIPWKEPKRVKARITTSAEALTQALWGKGVEVLNPRVVYPGTSIPMRKVPADAQVTVVTWRGGGLVEDNQGGWIADRFGPELGAREVKRVQGSLKKSLPKRTQPDLVASGRVATEVAAQTSPAGGRNPGHGTFPNFMEGNVGRHPVKMHPALEGWDPNETNPLEVEQKRIHVDAEDYLLTIGEEARQPLKVMPIPHGVADALYVTDEEEDRRGVQALKDWLNRHEVANRQRPRNTVEVDQE
jgi:hypothetical protein